MHCPPLLVSVPRIYIIILGSVGGVVVLAVVVAFVLWRRHKHGQSTAASDAGLNAALLPNDGMGGNSQPLDDSIWQHDPAEEAPAPGVTFQKVIGLAIGSLTDTSRGIVEGRGDRT